MRPKQVIHGKIIEHECQMTGMEKRDSCLGKYPGSGPGSARVFPIFFHPRHLPAVISAGDIIAGRGGVSKSPPRSLLKYYSIRHFGAAGKPCAARVSGKGTATLKPKNATFLRKSATLFRATATLLWKVRSRKRDRPAPFAAGQAGSGTSISPCSYLHAGTRIPCRGSIRSVRP